MEITVAKLWECWKRFRRGKRRTAEFDRFAYDLESNLFSLQRELMDGTYCHGSYRRFTAYENKRREIVVASIRDRIVHRWIYEHLVGIFDTTFLHDLWSCRKGKGLLAAILRAQTFMRRYKGRYVWRADIKKFFDNVDHEILFKLVARRVKDARALSLIKVIIDSYSAQAVCERERERERVKCREKSVFRSEISQARFLQISTSMNLIDWSSIP